MNIGVWDTGRGDAGVVRANVGEVLVEKSRDWSTRHGWSDVLERSLSLHPLSLDIQSPHI